MSSKIDLTGASIVLNATKAAAIVRVQANGMDVAEPMVAITASKADLALTVKSKKGAVAMGMTSKAEPGLEITDSVNRVLFKAP